MMTENISRRDWERLSAYLDQQLSAKESARLKARMQTDIVLLNAFKELQMARVALKQLPHLRAPRNFTLTPEMVGIRKQQPSRWYPAFRFASMLTSLLFVFIIVGDFFSRGAVTMQQDMASPAMIPAAEVSVAESIEAEIVSGESYSDVEVGLLEVEPAPEMEAINSAEEGIAGEDASVEIATEAAAEERDTAMAESPAPLVAEEDTAGEEYSVEKTSEDGAEETKAAIVESPVPLAETENQERGIYSSAPEESPSLEELQTDNADLENQAEQTPPISDTIGILWLPLLKIFIGAAAVVTTIITLYLRKQER